MEMNYVSSLTQVWGLMRKIIRLMMLIKRVKQLKINQPNPKLVGNDIDMMTIIPFNTKIIPHHHLYDGLN